MADVTDIGELVAEYRGRLIDNFESNPKVASIAAFDGVTELLLAVVDELRELRLRGIQRNA
jgi:hypothetical protein